MQRRESPQRLRLPTQAAPVARDLTADRGRSGAGRGVEPAQLTSTPTTPIPGMTPPPPVVVGTSPCEHLSGMARQMCYSLHYGLAV